MVLNKTSFTCFILVLGLCFICYYPALYAPFYLDDFGSLVGNQKLDAVDVELLFNSYGLRFIGYLSFALSNVYIGHEPFDYRVVNITIHVLNSLLVFSLVQLLLKVIERAEDQQGTIDASTSKVTTKLYVWIPVFAAVLFAVHPLNTQAVTYVVQRLASLVTLFYLLSCVLYLIARTADKKWLRFTALFAALCAASLAVLTKQNAVTLLLVFFLFECVLFRNPRIFKLGVITALSVAIFFAAMFVFPTLGDWLVQFDKASRETMLISRIDYFASQMLLIWDYISKFFFPVDLQLNYSNETQNGFSNPFAIIALLAHVLMVTVAILVRKSKPLITIGVLFYYITHLVESSLIPITDIGFEHRTYLPNVGLIIAMLGLCIYLVSHKCSQQLSTKIPKILLIVGFVVVAALSVTTFQRNQLWADKLAFSLNEVQVSPASIRAKTMVAAEYLNQGDPVKALTYYQQAVDLSVQRQQISFDLLRDYIKTLYALGKFESTGTLTTLVMKYTNAHKRKDKSEVMALIAISHQQAGRYGFAKGMLKQAIKLDPSNAIAHHQLASLLWNLGERLQAKQTLQRFINKNPADQQINALLSQMHVIEAAEARSTQSP